MFAESRTAASNGSAALDSVAAVSTTDVVVVDPAATDLSEDLQRKIYELVKTRVLQSIGAGANWTVAFRSSADTDSFFSDTMADMIAWDVAHQLIEPTVPNRARLAS